VSAFLSPEQVPGAANPYDQLELEVRQLEGVTFVGLDDQGGRLLVEVAGDEDADADTEGLRLEVQRLASTFVDGEVVVSIMRGGNGPRGDGRVALQVALPVPGTASVELHLAFRERRAAVEADGDDGAAVARAVITGLGVLGFPAPYGVVAAHELPDELGAGTIVLLEHATTGERRRGLAHGRSAADSAARAVLNALNRFLQPAGIPVGLERVGAT
jgi:hypothetical protein